MQGLIRQTALALLATALPLTAEAAMTVKLGAPWDGKTVPRGQQCSMHGGKGTTPPMAVAGLPKGTAGIVVYYNDLNSPPLSKNGGHGILSFPAKGASATLPAVPGGTKSMPAGVTLVKGARELSSGYLPPCSGGRGHRYVADVVAVGADGKALETLRVDLGRY